MPSILEAPEVVEHDTYDVTIERSQPRSTRPGFWRTLGHWMSKHLTYTPRARQAPVSSVPRPFETPMDWLAREHPALTPMALAMV